ncbi:MAG: hypothetical protein ACLQVI_05660 [Polyangiaceae bacterium]
MNPLSSLAALCLLPSIAACVSNSSPPPPASDSGTLPPEDSAAPAQDATVQDAATEDAAAVLAVCIATTVLADGACNTVQNVDPTPVTGTCPAGAQPVGVGGTVVDGTYVLTAQVRYADAGCGGTFQSTMIVQGGCCERTDLSGTLPFESNSTFQTTGNVLTRATTCGLVEPPATYTATPTTITIFDEGGSVTTWTKQ